MRLMRKNCGRNMAYTAIFRRVLKLDSTRVVFRCEKSQISQLLRLEMAPIRDHFEGKSKHVENYTRRGQNLLLWIQ